MERQSDQPAIAGPRFSRIHAVVLVAMCLVVGMLAWTTWSARSLVLAFVPQVNAAMQSRISVTEAHLWLEEIVSGDTSEDPQQVWDKIAEANWYLTAMLKGGERGDTRYLAVTDPVLRADLLAAESTLLEFERLARERVANAGASASRAAEAADAAELLAGGPEPASGILPADASPAVADALAGFAVGSDIDEQFDQAFARYFANVQAAESHLGGVIDASLRAFVVTQLVLMAAVAALFGWIVWLLQRKEAMDRSAHVSSLQASLDRLAQSQRELERQNALRGAMVEISDGLQGVEAPAEIARIALDLLCVRSGACVGICWSYRAGEGLSRLAARALPAERQSLVFLEDGEGLAGRVARDQQPLRIDVPSDYLPVASALGAAPAPHLRVLPLVHDRVTVGVMELAFLSPPEDGIAELLVNAAPAVAVRLHLAQRALAA